MSGYSHGCVRARTEIEKRLFSCDTAPVSLTCVFTQVCFTVKILADHVPSLAPRIQTQTMQLQTLAGTHSTHSIV